MKITNVKYPKKGARLSARQRSALAFVKAQQAAEATPKPGTRPWAVPIGLAAETMIPLTSAAKLVGWVAAGVAERLEGLINARADELRDLILDRRRKRAGSLTSHSRRRKTAKKSKGK